MPKDTEDIGGAPTCEITFPKPRLRVLMPDSGNRVKFKWIERTSRVRWTKPRP